MNWPHPSLVGEVGPLSGPDEHTQFHVLTSGFQPLPRLPGKFQWLSRNRIPLQWRNRPRISRGSECLPVFNWAFEPNVKELWNVLTSAFAAGNLETIKYLRLVQPVPTARLSVTQHAQRWAGL